MTDYTNYSTYELIERNDQAGRNMLELQPHLKRSQDEGWYDTWASEWDHWHAIWEDTRDELRTRGISVEGEY